MHVLHVVALLVYTFGAFAYAALLAISADELRQSPGLKGITQAVARTARVSLALWAVCFLWFVVNLLLVLATLAPPLRAWPIYMAAMWLSFAFPPLIMHITWAEVMESRRRQPGAGWGRAIWLSYLLAAGIAAATTLAFFGVGDLPPARVGQWSSFGLIGSFIAASIYAMALLTGYPRPAPNPVEQQSTRWTMGLFGVMAALFALMFVLGNREATAPAALQALEITLKSLPIAFMFVGTYFEHRFEFFDLFIKRGLSLFATIAVLVAAFAVGRPVLRFYDDAATWPWVAAILFLPVVMAVPWLHGRIGALLDRAWLGRRFTSVNAVQHFLAGLRSATTEEQLVRQAETGLSAIFDAPAIVILEGGPPRTFAGGEAIEEAEIRSGGRPGGRFAVGPRRSQAPYFSEDIALLESLADVFASVLENVRLQQREQEQNRRAHELSLNASQSELKALRAQINPHFLFNALNAIAGLIHRNPEVADRTIEKLADVFRYTLRGSEGEWALLDDELEFVRAYLEVEQARFGARLRASVHLDEGARGARVPTMIVQTLVENAVKHGAAALKGGAVITVSACRQGGELRVVVEDNGPGFAAKPERSAAVRSGGYGLANIRQRLAGHFGDRAQLTVERDAGRAVTVVGVAMPFLREEPRPTVAVTEEARP